MSPNRRTPILAATAAAAAFGALAAFTALAIAPSTPLLPPVTSAANADEIDDEVASLLATAKPKDGESDGMKAAVGLKENIDQRVTAAFIKLTKSKHHKLAAWCIVEVARRHDPKFQKTVKSKIGDKKMPKDKPKLYEAYLTAAKHYRDPKMGGALEKAVKKYLPMKPQFSTKAIRAYGTVPKGEVVENLVKWLQMTESTGGGGGGAAKMSTEQRAAYDAAKGAITETLAELTGVDIGDGAKWKEFWDENEKGFKFPDPDAPPTDWAALKDWSDVAYGYTLTLPEGAGWSFIEPDHGELRSRIANRDDEDNSWGRFDAWQTNMTRGDIKSMKNGVDYYLKQFNEDRFSQIKGGEPGVEETKFGGREFTVITAIGENKGIWSTWGAAETRVYLTKVDHILMRFEITVRLGAEDDIKAGFWRIIETSKWK